MEAKVVIPSKGRAKSVMTLKHVKGAALCVQESEAAIYAEYNPGTEIVTHPDDLIGLPRKRDWIYEKFGNVFQMDDDILGIKRVCQKQGESDLVGPEECYDIIQFLMNMTKMMGIYICTFNYEKNPMYYTGHEPFKLSGNICEPAYGMIAGGVKLKCHPDITASYEWYMSGINAFYYRMCLMDQRYSICKPPEKEAATKGGIFNQRTLETEKKDLRIMINAFGDAVIGATKGDAKRIMFQKKLRVPF